MKTRTELAELVVKTEITKQGQIFEVELLNPEIESLEISGNCFVSFTANIKGSAMIRYGLYFIRGHEILYSDSNVRDNTLGITPQLAKQRAKVYFRHYANILNNLK